MSLALLDWPLVAALYPSMMLEKGNWQTNPCNELPSFWQPFPASLLPPV